MFVQFQNGNNQRVGKTIIIGGFRIHYLPKIVAISFALITLFTYYMATIRTHEVKPFPHCTITETATYYPQNIAFRYIILPQLGIVAIFYLTLYYIFVGVSKKLDQRNLGSIWTSVCTAKILFILGLLGLFLLAVAVATIDSYKMNNLIHGGSAIVGFAVMWITMLMICYLYKKALLIQPDIVSEKSLNVKSAIASGISAILVYVLTHPMLNNGGFSMVQTSILEYTLFFSLCLFIYTFTWDFENFYYFFSLQSLLLNNLQSNPIVSSVSLMTQDEDKLEEVIGTLQTEGNQLQQNQQYSDDKSQLLNNQQTIVQGIQLHPNNQWYPQSLQQIPLQQIYSQQQSYCQAPIINQQQQQPRFYQY